MYKYLNPVIFVLQRIYEAVLTKVYKPRIKGTWKEINQILKTFSSNPTLYIDHGLLIRFVAVKNKEYSKYIFIKIQRGILKFRKRDKYFMIPGDCGSYNLDNPQRYIFELLEIPRDMLHINFEHVKKKYRIKRASKNSSQYY